LTGLRFKFLVSRRCEEITTILMTRILFPVVGSRIETQDDRTIAHFDVRPGTLSRIAGIDIRFRGVIAEPGGERTAHQGVALVGIARECGVPATPTGKGQESLLRELRSKRYPAEKIVDSEALVDPRPPSCCASSSTVSTAFTFGDLAIEG
jgi:hypothetical protein